MPSYLAELVARTPTLDGPPDFEVVAPLRFSQLTMVDELSRDGFAELTTTVGQLDGDARWRLADPFARPCEMRVLRDGDLWWQGPVWTVGLHGQRVQIHCRGLGGYLRLMMVGPDTGDLTFTDVDQHLIVAGLIDAWQNLDFGDFGIDTSQVAASGKTRDRTYPAGELQDMYTLATRLGEVRDGFDLEIGSGRVLACHFPEKGTVREAWLDARNIGSADEQRSVADGAVATVAYANTSDGEAGLAVAAAVDADAVATFGRAAVGSSHDGVVEQATLDDYAAANLAARSQLDWQPGPGVRPVAEMGVADVEVGDRLGYRFDAGLGLVDEEVRVVRRQVSVGEDGAERLGIEVA